MATSAKTDSLVKKLTQNYLFRDLESGMIKDLMKSADLVTEKLYSSRPVYTAYRPGNTLSYLYLVVSGGPIIMRSSPLDRMIGITYPGSCFGFGSLPVGCALISPGFPSLVESYKTTDVLKISTEQIQALYDTSEPFRDRYNLLFELREKFQYHLLNCSTYPPQAVAALIRALIYQERMLGNQPGKDQIFSFDLPVDIIAHACQLNHRTVEQVLKGMEQNGLIEKARATDLSGDMIHVLDADGMKEVYSTTRDKVSWWPLK
jgi:hypothetical protein